MRKDLNLSFRSRGIIRGMLMVAFVCFAGVGFSQSKITLTGKVVDEKKAPMDLVNIQIKGTQVGTQTAEDGTFMLEVEQGATLIISCVGYDKQEVKVNGTTMNITMLGENMMEEHVIIGYQSVQKKFTSTSVASVNAADLANLPSASLSGLLAGKATGVMSVNLGGGPGTSGAIVIRGNTVVSGSLGDANQFSNPLYVIDGVPMTLEEVAGGEKTNGDFLASLNMDDIDKLDILKDAAAAAIYGSKGANGVIIIQTKKGTPGKTKVTGKAYAGVTVRPDLMKTPIGMAERRLKMALVDQWDYAYRRTLVPMLFTDSLNPAFNNNMDYQGMFYQAGVVQDYALSIEGGQENLYYRISGSYYGETGIIKETGFNRYTVALNLTQKPWERVRNNTIVKFAYTDRKPGLGNSNSRGNFPISMMDMPSSLFSISEDKYNYYNGRLEEYYHKDRSLNASISNDLKVDIWKGIVFNSQVSGFYYSNKRNLFEPSTIRTSKTSRALYDYDQKMTAISETFLSYAEKFAKNHFGSAIIGTSFEYSQSEGLRIDATNGSSDDVVTVSGFPRESTSSRSTINQNAMLSYYARLTYRFMDRYQVDLNYRRDASSRFGKNKRWAAFPSVAFLWIFSDESFLDFSNKWLSTGKLSYSLGRTGKQFSSDYLRYNLYSLSYNSFSSYNGQMGTNSYNGVTATIPNFSQIADDNLSWESTIQHNMALDLDFWKNRIYLKAEYYIKNTSDILFDVTFPDYTGFGVVKANVASVRNYGYEVMVDAHAFKRTNPVTLNVQFGFSHNDNIITKLPNGDRDFINGDATYGYSLGKPSPIFYGFQYLGPIQYMEDLPVNPYTGQVIQLTQDGNWGKAEPGYPLLADLSGDYDVRDVNDRSLLDIDANPKIIGHFNIVLGYKNWTLRVNNHYTFGRDIYDQVSQRILNRYDNLNWQTMSSINIPDYDFWTPTNRNSRYPSLYAEESASGARQAFRSQTTLWWEPGDFWKINDITVQYNFKQNWMKQIGLSRLMVYGVVYNVWQWQKSKYVLDASMVDSKGHTIGDGYPNPRKFALGVNFTF